MKKRLNLRGSGQRGFTLLEIIIAIAISAILGLGAVVTLNQMVSGNDRASRDMTTIQQLESAGYRVSRDALTAQYVTTGENAGFPLQLDWQDWYVNGTTRIDENHRIEYSLSGSNLLRTKSFKLSTASSWVTESQTVVARNIDVNPARTFCSYSDHVITLNITAVTGNTSETYIYQIKPRTDSPY